jgi:hypothetical protein
MFLIDLKGGVIQSINEKAYNLDNIYDMISDSEKWKEKYYHAKD